MHFKILHLMTPCKAFKVSFWIKVWNSLGEGQAGCSSPRHKRSCLCKPQKIMQHMQGNISYMFDCWGNL